MPLVLTSCTNRKRKPPPRALVASRIGKGSLEAVAGVWGDRLARAKPVSRAADLYCGRAFRNAEDAARRLDAALYIVSAGLGMVPSDRSVPSYSLTVAPGNAENILRRIEGSPSAREWWGAISSRSPFSISLEEAARRDRGPILAALPSGYLGMVAGDLDTLSWRTRSRLRIFTLGDIGFLPEALRQQVMPYDARFDGKGSPLPGTRGDFAQRALWHFANVVLPALPSADAAAHAASVNCILGTLRPRMIPKRQKLSDPEISQLIRRHWHDACGQSSRMLRYLRDTLGIACEQGRFKNLFQAVRPEFGETA